MEPGSPVVAEEHNPNERLSITREELASLIEDVLRARGVMA
jgi:hypothetical protein